MCSDDKHRVGTGDYGPIAADSSSGKLGQSIGLQNGARTRDRAQSSKLRDDADVLSSIGRKDAGAIGSRMHDAMGHDAMGHDAMGSNIKQKHPSHW